MKSRNRIIDSLYSSIGGSFGGFVGASVALTLGLRLNFSGIFLVWTGAGCFVGIFVAQMIYSLWLSR